MDPLVIRLSITPDPRLIGVHLDLPPHSGARTRFVLKKGEKIEGAVAIFDGHGHGITIVGWTF